MKIGEVSQKLGVNQDTLRYYEKIGLLPRIARSESGLREYTNEDIERFLFIKRAQHMRFTLNEIASLVAFRENSGQVKPQVRKVVKLKLEEVAASIDELSNLHNELLALTRLCCKDDEATSCPILDKLDGGSG